MVESGFKLWSLGLYRYKSVLYNYSKRKHVAIKDILHCSKQEPKNLQVSKNVVLKFECPGRVSGNQWINGSESFLGGQVWALC